MSNFTVKELKAMLAGMDMLTGKKDWTPDKKQWQKIRQKIDQLEEVVMLPTVTPASNTAGQTLTVQADGLAVRPRPAQPQPSAPARPPNNVQQPAVSNAQIENEELLRIRDNMNQNFKAQQSSLLAAAQMPAPQAGNSIVPPIAGSGRTGPILGPVKGPTDSEFL